MLPLKQTEQVSKTPFLSDIKTIRDRARKEISKGAITPIYQGDPEASVRILNEALATEIVCVLRYKSHYYGAEGIHAEAAKKEFKEHAEEEQRHADQIAERIKQLNGTPNFDPKDILTRSHSEFTDGKDLVDMIREDLVAERIAIESYKEIIQYFGENDPTSRRLMESILEKEEEHADDMADLLKSDS